MLATLILAAMLQSPATVVAESPDTSAILEDLSWDGARGRFIISDVRHHRLRAVDLRGRWSSFGEPFAAGWAPLGIAVDSARGVIWVDLATLPQAEGFTPADSSHAAIERLDLATGALQRRFDLPGRTRAAPGDLAIALNHDLYSGDGMVGAIYVIHASRDSLETLVAPGALHSTQQPAILPDQRRLIIPDYRRGPAVVDLESGMITWVAHEPDMALGGMDGILLRGHELIGVQNGRLPGRIIRLELDSSFTSIVSGSVMLRDTVLADEPAHVVLLNGALYTIGNAGWSKYDDDGRPIPGVLRRPPKLLRLPI